MWFDFTNSQLPLCHHKGILAADHRWVILLDIEEEKNHRDK